LKARDQISGTRKKATIAAGVLMSSIPKAKPCSTGSSCRIARSRPSPSDRSHEPDPSRKAAPARLPTAAVARMNPTASRPIVTTAPSLASVTRLRFGSRV
jgi:hypothetical protein